MYTDRFYVSIFYFCFLSHGHVCNSIDMRLTKNKMQSKRKPIVQTTDVNLPLCEKYGFKLTSWQPPAIISKHLKNLNDDSILMDTDTELEILEAIPVAACKSNDITMKEDIGRTNSEMNMELSLSDGATQSQQSEAHDAKVAEMVVDSGNDFQVSQPLFDSYTEEFESHELSHKNVVTTERPIEMEPEKTVADPVSPHSDNDNFADFKKSPKEQPTHENDDSNTSEQSPCRKRLKQYDSQSLTPPMLRLTGNIDNEDFATKLCRLKTTDEMISFCAEQTQRVDQLMEELFSMSKITENLLNELNTSIYKR